jgi:hypothetical protein
VSELVSEVVSELVSEVVSELVSEVVSELVSEVVSELAPTSSTGATHRAGNSTGRGRLANRTVA